MDKKLVEKCLLTLNRGGILSDVEVDYYNRGAKAQLTLAYPIIKQAVTEEIKKDNKIVPNFLYKEMSKALELEFENKYGKSSWEE